MKKLKLNDIASDANKQLTELNIDELIPLPPPYDRAEELPGFKQLTEDQKQRLVCNLDGVVSYAGLPKPENEAEKKKYVEQFVKGLKKLLDKENNWTFLQPLILSLDTAPSARPATMPAQYTLPAARTNFTVPLTARKYSDVLLTNTRKWAVNCAPSLPGRISS